MNKIKIAALFLFVSVTMSVTVGCGIKKSDTIKNKYNIKAQTLNSNIDIIRNANNKVAFKFLSYEMQAHKNSNIVISPLSLNTVLTMTQNGAANNTKDEMLAVLELKNIDDSTINENYKSIIAHFNSLLAVNTNMADSIWIQKGFKVNDDFINTGKSNYEAEINNVDFNKGSTVDVINKWVSDKTAGKIKKLNTDLKGSIMVLINTVFFKSKWAEPFKEKNTMKAPFNLNDGSKENVDMMNGIISVEYLKGKDFSAVRLPYDDHNFGFYVFLPDKGSSTDKLLQNMNYDNWNKFLTDFKPAEVNIKLPKFKLEYENDLNTMLQGFGMKSAFNGNADFSKLSDKEKLYIDKVKQKCYIDVNEAGTEAAAATEVNTRMGVVIRPSEFTVDRPFMYAIADKKTGLIIFMGKVEKP